MLPEKVESDSAGLTDSFPHLSYTDCELLTCELPEVSDRKEKVHKSW